MEFALGALQQGVIRIRPFLFRFLCITCFIQMVEDKRDSIIVLSIMHIFESV